MRITTTKLEKDTRRLSVVFDIEGYSEEEQYEVMQRLEAFVKQECRLSARRWQEHELKLLKEDEEIREQHKRAMQEEKRKLREEE